uniref:LAGLIDADG endonuclease n=1 Tax=Ophiognomonia clavigignenti-juglandacearum TaxID=218668 RepID=A0A2C9DSC6_9PEZI|nr:LAGLIDADG endonuclease [Ophiognomonia clavigignenti-juglandacearum]
MAGFTSGEGSFRVNIRKATTKSGYGVPVSFVLTQHSRDSKLLRSFESYFDCGKYYPGDGNQAGRGDYIIQNLQDITEKLIPFFDQYSIYGNKLLDYQDFSEVVKLKNHGAHLTPEGLEKIRVIQQRMNQSRGWVKPEPAVTVTSSEELSSKGIHQRRHQPVAIKNIVSGQTNSFSSIAAASRYLAGIGVKASGHTISKYLLNGQLFQNYKFYNNENKS